MRSGGPSGETQTGTQEGDRPEAEQTDRDHGGGLGTLEAMAVQGSFMKAMADGLRAPRPRPPRPGPYSRNPTTPPPPPKISMGK